MPLGQSAIVGSITGTLVERGAYLVERANGASVRDARLRAEEVGISAQVAAGTATAVVTGDPVGGALNIAHSSLRENDRAMFKEGK